MTPQEYFAEVKRTIGNTIRFEIGLEISEALDKLAEQGPLTIEAVRRTVFQVVASRDDGEVGKA